MGKRLHIRPLLDSRGQVGIANLINSALYFSLLLSVVQLLAMAYVEVCSTAVHGASERSYMPGHHCRSKLWAADPTAV